MLSTKLTRPARRGIVLVLVLAMLGLLALIGITFATYSGQAKINARNYAQSLNRPQDDELMDFALSQLITDTGDVRSVIRGHSLARDMYGNDGRFNGYVTSRPGGMGPSPFNYTTFYITNVASAGGTLYDLTTNIPQNDPALYGYNFTRWIMRLTVPGSPAVRSPDRNRRRISRRVGSARALKASFIASPLDYSTFV